VYSILIFLCCGVSSVKSLFKIVVRSHEKCFFISSKRRASLSSLIIFVSFLINLGISSFINFAFQFSNSIVSAESISEYSLTFLSVSIFNSSNHFKRISSHNQKLPNFHPELLIQIELPIVLPSVLSLILFNFSFNSISVLSSNFIFFHLLFNIVKNHSLFIREIIRISALIILLYNQKIKNKSKKIIQL